MAITTNTTYDFAVKGEFKEIELTTITSYFEDSKPVMKPSRKIMTYYPVKVSHTVEQKEVDGEIIDLPVKVYSASDITSLPDVIKEVAVLLWTEELVSNYIDKLEGND